MSAIAGLSVALASTRIAGFAPRQAPTATLPIYGYTVVRSYPHDPGAFTQGLQYVGETATATFKGSQLTVVEGEGRTRICEREGTR